MNETATTWTPRRVPVPREDIQVVLVAYRSRPHIEALLDMWPDDLRVVVVDNSSGADGLDEVAAAHPQVTLVDGGGQGFARGANIGARAADAPYVVFVNPDSRPTVEDLTSLVEGLAADPSAVSHAATVTGADGEVEIGVGGWEPTVARTAAYAVGLHKKFPRIGVYAKPQLGEREVVEWTTGACMAVDARRFAELGGFDESFFVYCEDMSFGRRARLAGLRQVLRPDVTVLHGAGASGAPSVEMLRLRGASFANYVERYHGGLPATAMRAAMAAGYTLRAAEQTLRGDRDLAAQHRAMVRGVVSRRAFVGKQEVALARFAETVPDEAQGHVAIRDGHAVDGRPYLFVTKEFGVPATSGGMLRTLAMARWLSGRAPVVVVSPAGVTGVRRDEAGEVVVETLRPAPERSLLSDALTLPVYRSIGAPRTCGSPLLTGLQETLDRLGPFRAAIVDHTCAFAVADRLPEGMPVLLSTHNVESDLMEQRAEAETGWRKPAAHVEARLLRRLETTVGRRHPLIACTVDDGAAVVGSGAHGRVVVARNGVTPPQGAPREQAQAEGRIEPGSLLFTGALDWRPNVNGILWLLESDAWRRLVERRPDIRITVAGRNPSEGFRARVEAAPHARVAADVPSMTPYLCEARLGVAPLLEGGGSRIKLLEYIGHGLPAVATEVGASGLDGLPDGVVVRTPEDAEAFCAAVETALDTTPVVLSPQTVDATLALYGWDNALEPIGDALDELERG